MAVEALDLYRQIHARNRKWSWRRPIPLGLAAFLVSVLIRAGVGVVVAGAFAASNQVSGAIGALALGVGAPLVVEKLARAAATAATAVDVAPPPGSPPEPEPPFWPGPAGGAHVP